MSAPPPPAGSIELLQAQLDDLDRLRQLVAAQRAVLHLDDRELLAVYAREAVEVADAVLARDTTLLALRLAAHRDPRPTEEPRYRSLEARVDQARTHAGNESRALARRMEQEAHHVARDLEQVGRQLERVIGSGFGRSLPGEPILVDRTG